jgi:hypothetical protein
MFDMGPDELFNGDYCLCALLRRDFSDCVVFLGLNLKIRYALELKCAFSV